MVFVYLPFLVRQSDESYLQKKTDRGASRTPRLEGERSLFFLIFFRLYDSGQVSYIFCFCNET